MKCIAPFLQLRLKRNQVTTVVGERQDIHAPTLVGELTQHFDDTPRALSTSKPLKELADQAALVLVHAFTFRTIR